MPYRADPAPLTFHGELRALLAGRRSYALSAGRLIHRNRDRIRGDLRRGRPVVFASHRCAQPPSAADIDPRHAPAVLGLLRRMQATDTGEDDEAALFLIVTDLGGRVIGLTPDTQEPPF